MIIRSMTDIPTAELKDIVENINKAFQANGIPDEKGFYPLDVATHLIDRHECERELKRRATT